MLARLTGAAVALEVGTFTGYGAVAIARGLVDGGTLTCLELREEYAEIARRNLADAGLDDRVEIVVGPADESLRAMPEEPMFDFVYLDADKTGYPAYYDLILPRLQRGGLLVIDNVLLNGDVVDPQDERSRIMDDVQRSRGRGRAGRQRDGARRRRAHARASALTSAGDDQVEGQIARQLPLPSHVLTSTRPSPLGSTLMRPSAGATGVIPPGTAAKRRCRDAVGDRSRKPRRCALPASGRRRACGVALD